MATYVHLEIPISMPPNDLVQHLKTHGLKKSTGYTKGVTAIMVCNPAHETMEGLTDAIKVLDASIDAREREMAAFGIGDPGHQQRTDDEREMRRRLNDALDQRMAEHKRNEQKARDARNATAMQDLGSVIDFSKKGWGK